MKFRDRPLLVDGVDRALYLPRPTLEGAVLLPLAAGGNVLVLGEAGSGKSTLLRWVAAKIKGSVAWVNAAPAVDALSFLELVDDALGEEPTALRQNPATGTALGLLAAARRLRREEPSTILVDGLIDPAIGYDVFGRLRDELWETGHVWMVAMRPRDSGPLRTPPADAFWSQVVDIPPLDGDETRALLHRGLEAGERRRVEADRPIAGVYPRELIRDAQATLTRAVGEPGPAVARHDLLSEARHLGRSEEMAMGELLELGRPVSAHDDEFLDPLGWSRAYAQRMLARLESAGLVRSVPERSGLRTGRPRKLYEPAPRPMR